MRRIASFAALIATLAVPAAAQEPPPVPEPPSAPDESPTGFSCTAATLLQNEECVFESEAAPATDPAKQAKLNQKYALALAAQACTSAARLSPEGVPDPVVLALCNEAARPLASSCADGRFPLLDAQGRFAPTQRSCYVALAELLRRTRFMADVSARCCRCAAKAGCASDAARCNRRLTQPVPDVPTCAASACASECSAVLPSAPVDDEFAPRPRAPCPGAAPGNSCEGSKSLHLLIAPPPGGAPRTHRL